MQISRLCLAIDNATVVLPDSGRIAVIGPHADTDLTCLPKDRVHVIQGFKPDHQHFTGAGYDTSISPEGNYILSIIFLPRAKPYARQLIAQALQNTNGGPVVIDGQKTNGIDSLLKDCRKHGATVTGVFSKSHGKLFSVSGGDFSGWAALNKDTKLADQFITVPGVFSADKIDKGSGELVQALPDKIVGRVADLGAGWGYLSHYILQREAVTECHLIEADYSALDCARRNVTDPRAQFQWADATSFRDNMPFGTVVCNPPFHTSRAAEPALGQAFIATAARILSSRGTLWLVANRHLPYEAALTKAFHSVEEVAGSSSFKIFRASKPQRRRAR